MQFTYALPKDSQAWQTALNSVFHTLPEQVTAGVAAHELTAEQLSDLPVFAVVVVNQNKTVNVDELMQTWVESQSFWQIVSVHDDEQAKAQAHLITSPHKLADISLHRYLLAPSQKTHMGLEQKNAAAHIIDQQISAHLAQHTQADVHILSISQMLNQHRLACFDMDSTLIEEEVIVELARFCQVEDEVSEITEQAMRGEIDFATSFARRVALLKGAPISIIDTIIKERIHIQPGAFATIQALKSLGYHTVLVSGGFEPFAQYVANSLGMDEYYANPLLNDEAQLTGQVDEMILDGHQKAVIAQKTAARLGLGMHQVACIGDGANDLPMMGISDIGIAYKAKPIVQTKASAAINLTGLEGVLYALGHRLDAK